MPQQLCTIPRITEVPENYRALWELCLTDVWCPASLEEWRERIDSPREIDADSILFVNLFPSDREELTQVFGFPTVEFPALPSIEQVNEALPNRFETTHLFKQSDVATEITERIRKELPQIVVLLVLDGLSFYDVVDWELPQATLEPCLVDGLSVTNSAMQRLIGSPVLTHRLFELGYIRRSGFSYWERAANVLTDALFAEFPPNQLHRMTTFDEVLRKIKASGWETHTYVQIIRSGLDGVCHSNRERPNTKSILDDLKRDILLLLEVLQETGKSFRLFITADHGILWYADQDIIPLAQEKFKTRYTEGNVASGDNVLTLQSEQETYTVLTGDKVIAKNRKSNEWGFHGGISGTRIVGPILGHPWIKWEVFNG